MIRRIISTAALIAFLVFGATVPLGKHTLFGHLARIWKSDETQDLVEDVKESTGPMVDKVKRGAKAGWEAVKDDAGADAPDGGAGTVLDKARDEARDRIADEAGEIAEDVARNEVKSRLGGD